MSDVDGLVRTLTRELTPVRRLWPTAARWSVWAAVSLAVVLLTAVSGLRHGLDHAQGVVTWTSLCVAPRIDRRRGLMEMDMVVLV